MSALSPELSEEIRRGIKQHQLDAVAESILANSAECYAMVVVGTEDYSVVGNTRFGGEPDLPPSVKWPNDGEGRFSNFIGQINFSELPPLFSGSPLPPSGVLYLFVRYMESAAEPVLLDAIYFNGDVVSLQRTVAPDPDQMADEYLTNLQPVKIRGIPAISFATFRKEFRAEIDRAAGTIADDSGFMRLIQLEISLHRPGQIGQMLGFANAGDERENLYRHVCLEKLGQRNLTYCDHWDSMEEYEAYKKQWQDQGDAYMVAFYENMRRGVTWLVRNGDAIRKAAAEWRLLFRVDSNREMDLDMMDADPLYVFIRDADLASRSFHDVAGEVTQG